VAAADRLSAARLGIAAVLWPLALAGQGRVVAAGLVLAGVTDALDGFLARRVGQASVRGARLDAIADTALMLSAAAWIGILHPDVVRDHGALLLAVAMLYALSTGVSWVAFRRLVDPRQLSAKVAGGLLYLFALVTLFTDVVAAALLVLALAALAVSCLTTIVTASHAIHARATASSHRSHAPQNANGVVSSTSPAASVVTSSAPSPTDTRP
jgi:cardiolipin synthase